MATALVTGAAGFIGSHLVDELLDRGNQVIGLDNRSTGSLANLKAATQSDRFQFVEADIRDRAAVAEAMTGVEQVFHFAAYTSVPGSVERPAHVSAVNCTGTATVLDVAANAGVDSVVQASSAAVYGSEAPVPVAETTPPSPESPYAASKLYAEHLGEQIGEETELDVVSLRLFNVYGPRQDPDGDYAAVVPAFIDRLADGTPPIIYGDGDQTRDFVFVEDVVNASLAATEAGVSGLFNVGTGNRTSITTLAATLSDILGVDEEPVHEAPRPGDIRHSGAVVDRLEDTIGYTPTVSLREGLQQTVLYFQS